MREMDDNRMLEDTMRRMEAQWQQRSYDYREAEIELRNTEEHWMQMLAESDSMLRLEAGKNPHDKGLIELVGRLSTSSELFRQRWASHDVQFHRGGQKRLRHPVVGQLDLDVPLAAQHASDRRGDLAR